MASKNVSAKEFAQIVKSAKVEINGIFKSPFVVINLLNKAAKGDFNKIKGANISRENLAKVAKVLKGLHSGRYAFDMCLLTKDNKGRICSVSTSKIMPVWDYQLIDVLPNKGYKYYKPINLTINALFNEFAKVAKVEIKEIENAEKEDKKAAKKAEKVLENRIKDLNNAFSKGILTEFEYNEKMKALKAA